MNKRVGFLKRALPGALLMLTVQGGLVGCEDDEGTPLPAADAATERPVDSAGPADGAADGALDAGTERPADSAPDAGGDTTEAGG